MFWISCRGLIELSKQGSSTEDAVAALVHIITKHLDKCNSYVRALFLDFSSAFDTIQVNTLVSKLMKLDVNPYLIKWYTSLFLPIEPKESK